MMTYLLDTNIVSYSLKPIYIQLRRKIGDELNKGTMSMSAITRAELRAGQSMMQHDDKRIATIEKVFVEIPTLDWTSDCADIYGELENYLVKTGQSIGIMDTQIAAQALADNLTLVTHNTKHFKRIPNLKLEDWTLLDHAAIGKKNKP
jgi:predicted nucleic acid-binding protein